MVAVLSKRHNIPFYVACPLSTIDRSILSGNDIPIEERPIDEVTGYRDFQWAANGVSVRNPAFDLTPADLVTGFGTSDNAIETNLTSVDIDNSTSGDINIFESNAIDIFKIDHAGVGNINVSFN